MPLQIINKIKLNPRKLFLMDGLGAVLSASLYLLVLANFSDFFGMPVKELYLLGFLAVLYAIFSFTCYLIDLNYWQPYMKTIAFANLLHCVLTVGLVIYYYDQITIWGILYFIGELIIIIPLALLELKTAVANS